MFMLPKTHIILGAIFSIFIFFIFKITIFQAALIFFASFLIDFDHYLWYIFKKNDFSSKRAFKIFIEELRFPKKPLFMVFHSLEFLIFIFILSYFWTYFSFILIGLIFHSILDIIDLLKRGILNKREFLLTRYLIKGKQHYT